jgi:hypothetical protein
MEVHMLPITLSVARKPMGSVALLGRKQTNRSKWNKRQLVFRTRVYFRGIITLTLYHDLATPAFAAAVPTGTEQIYG